ncbi:MAG: hypothetical protein HQ517_05060 [SAR324 cluster bacterium]|nr:hypothetical protein [SAR324 cluster bacterium]
MPINEIKTVAFIGAGTMGCFNSLLAGIGGYDAILYDIAPDMFQLTEMIQEIIGADLVQKHLFTATQVAEGRKHIHCETDLNKTIADADLVSESVPENLELKQTVHRQLDALCPPHAIITTNTSGILISEIEEVVLRGEQFAALHFHLGSTLVDILGGPRTSSLTIDILYRFVKSIYCAPHVNRKENIGYVYNAIAPGMIQVAATMVIQHKERVEDVDRAWMINSGDAFGPFGLMDLLGINVFYDGAQCLSRYPVKQKMTEVTMNLLQPYVDKGEFGIRVGKGFYNYPDPVFQKPEFLKPDPMDDARYQTMVNGIIIQALLVVIDDVADAAEVDRVWMLARQTDAGPFGWLDDKGLDHFLKEIKYPVYAGIHPTERMDEIIEFLSPFLVRSELGRQSGKGFYSYPDPLFRQPGFLI